MGLSYILQIHTGSFNNAHTNSGEIIEKVDEIIK